MFYWIFIGPALVVCAGIVLFALGIAAEFIFTFVYALVHGQQPRRSLWERVIEKDEYLPLPGRKAPERKPRPPVRLGHS